MTTTMIDIDLTMLEDMGFARVCTPWHGYDCGREAEWVAIKQCCGMEIPLCPGHYVQSVDEYENLVGGPVDNYCCNTELRPAEPGFIRYERIK